MENNQDNVVLNGEPQKAENTQPQSNNSQNGVPVNPCPICGTPYTYVCPKCGFSPYVGRKNTKKNIFSKWWFWLIAVVLVFAIMIGSAACMIHFMNIDTVEKTSNYVTRPLCKVADIEVKFVPEKCVRDAYDITLTLEVTNNGDKNVSFYPTKASFDGRSITAYCGFSVDDTDLMWDYDSYYAEDESIIIKPGKRHLVDITFDSFYNEEGEMLEVDLRKFSNLDITFNVANPETLKVQESTQVNFDLTQIEAKKKYYDQE